MKLSECNVETNNIANLSDKPALTPTELKREFDKAGTGIKNYINGTLLKEVEDELDKKVPSTTNSYLMTKAEREKLAGIEEGANKVTIESGNDDPNELQIVADYYIQVFKEEE